VKLAGEHRFAQPREQVWEALVDPTVLARVLPGIEQLESTGGNAWQAAMMLAIGPVRGRFTGSLELSELRPPESYRLKLDGSGPSGFVRGGGTIALAEEEGATRLAYDLDAQVGGKLASVGQRMIESAGRALARQGLEGLERELAARAPAAATAGAPGEGEAPPAPIESGAPPSTAAFAARFAGNLWRELPASWRWTAAALAAALLVAVILLLRSC